MSLRDTVVKGVATIDKVTKSLQGTVQHYANPGANNMGTVAWSGVTPTARKAIVNQSVRRVMVKGQEVTVKATITFPRQLTIGAFDKIVLADGTTGPLVLVDGAFTDPVTGLSVTSEVHLGM